MILKKKWLKIRVIEKEQLLIEGVEKEIIKKIKKSKVKNDEVVKEIKKAEVKVLGNDEWQIKYELILKKEKKYVLKNDSLKLKIIQLHYNTLIAGYKG